MFNAKKLKSEIMNQYHVQHSSEASATLPRKMHLYTSQQKRTQNCCFYILLCRFLSKNGKKFVDE
jgi:hypothetical protein